MSDFIYPDWPAPVNVLAAMTTRASGSLREALSLPGEPQWLKQVHGIKVIEKLSPSPLVGEGRQRGDFEVEADASFTTQHNVVCAVQSADCLPVLFCDDAGCVVAAAHAGWRGLAAGVLQETVRALPVKPGTLMAWMGAAIGPAAFEVGEDVRAAFATAADAAAFERQTPGKYLANLYLLARLRLQSAGVSRIYGGGLCTYCDATRFFSYRRDKTSGRMAALIWRT